MFGTAPTPPSVEARAGPSLPPSHLIPLMSNAAATVKKKKKRREHRGALLAETTSRGYASPVQPPQIVSERSRSPSACTQTRAHSVPAKHIDDSVSDQPAPHALKHSTRRRQPASHGHHRTDFMPPKSASLDFVMLLFQYATLLD